MDSKKMPLDGLIIMKRLNTKESERGVDLKDTEFIFAAKHYKDIIKKLCKFPKNRLSWLVVAKFTQNDEGQFEYSDGVSGPEFLKQAQNYFNKQILLN